MKKIYDTPVLTAQRFETENILTSSGDVDKIEGKMNEAGVDSTNIKKFDFSDIQWVG